MPGVAEGVITNGLGGNASNMILGHFHLGFFDGEIVVPPPTGGGGGGGGTTSGPTYVPRPYREEDYPPEQKIEVTIKLRFGKAPVWREYKYWVLPKKVSVVVKAFALINATRSRMNLVATGLQNKVKSAIMLITNLTNKNDKK